MAFNSIHHTKALDLLKSLDDESIDMIYTDPPFGTGDVQSLSRRLSGKIVSKLSYVDRHDDYLNFMMGHVVELHRTLKKTGTMYLHLDWRWGHYVKVEGDKIFGYDNFLNEIVWSYNFGGRGTNKWPAKHDTILMYAKSAGDHTFNWDKIDRIPYAAPELQYAGRTKEEAEKRIAEGQVPTDVWSMSIVGTAAKERTGYPNQKPRKLIERAIVASSNPGDIVLDPFAGSGSTGAAAHARGRRFIMSDLNPQSILTMQNRFRNICDEIDWVIPQEVVSNEIAL